jgi:5-methylcytosine-specific restriction protein A
MRRACLRNGCPNRFEIDPYADRKPSYCPEDRGRAWQRKSKAAVYSYDGSWLVIRKQVLERDGYQCQLRFAGICIGEATEADHIIQPGSGGTDDLWNLRAVCRPCHARRTGRQGAIAKQRRAARRKE